MILNGIPISEEECIGDSLTTINSAFQTLSVETATLNSNLSSLTTNLSSLSSQATSGANGVPTGFVAYYSLSSAPTGWAECNGAAITVAMGSTYTNIRNFLIAGGSCFGVSGSDPKLPDLRGRFIRSFGTQSTSVSSAAFGVNQDDAFQLHGHNYSVWNSTLSFAIGCCGQALVAPYNAQNGLPRDLGGGSPRTASETRPVNLALLACIKL